MSKKRDKAIENFAKGVNAGYTIGNKVFAANVSVVLGHIDMLKEAGLIRYADAMMCELQEEMYEVSEVDGSNGGRASCFESERCETECCCDPVPK